MKKKIKNLVLPPLRALWNMGPKTAHIRKGWMYVLETDFLNNLENPFHNLFYLGESWGEEAGWGWVHEDTVSLRAAGEAGNGGQRSQRLSGKKWSECLNKYNDYVDNGLSRIWIFHIISHNKNTWYFELFLGVTGEDQISGTCWGCFRDRKTKTKEMHRDEDTFTKMVKMMALNLRMALA